MNSVEWLFGLGMNNIKLGLDNIRFLMNRLGNPQNEYKTIHVAGSDGKGSTSAMIHSILTENGFKTGLYTSPHIVRFNERIKANDVEITDDEISSYVDNVRPIVEEMKNRNMKCTFFEVTTAIAFLFFRDKGVDYAVIEVGLGGRFDATNVIVPEISVITNISLEHQAWLGDTIDKIAFEKSGIVKNYIPVVTCNSGHALDVIRNTCRERNSKLITIKEPMIRELKRDSTVMTYDGKEYTIGVPGEYQSVNASMAIETAKMLSLKHIGEGLSKVRWPYRLQMVEEDTVVDVTHTEAGSRAMCQVAKKLYGDVAVVFGVLSDKDVTGIAKNLSTITEDVFIISVDSERAMPADKIGYMMKGIIKNITICDTMDDAMKKAKTTGKTVLVTGSFYMAEEYDKWSRNK